MGLRTRLSLAFVLIVAVPVLAGSVIVAAIVPSVLARQAGDRLRAARVGVVDILAGRCVQANQLAQLLAADAAVLGPGPAIRQIMTTTTVDYAVIQSPDGSLIAAGSLPGAPAGSLPGAPTGRPLPASLNSCGDGRNLDVAISSRAESVLGSSSLGSNSGSSSTSSAQVSQVAVGWAVGPTMATRLSAGLDGRPAVTLVAGGRVISSTLPTALAARLATSTGTHAVPAVFRAHSTILAYSPASAGQPFGVVVSQPVPTTTRLSWLLASVVVLTVLAGLVMGRWLARLISDPIVELSQAARRVASGDLDIALPVRSKDEVGQLATAFNHMTGELRAYVGQLERSRDELRGNLSRLGATLAHTHDLPGILADILDMAMGSVQATGGAVMFLDGENNLAVQASRGLAMMTVPAGALIPSGVGISGRVARTGEPVCGRVGDSPLLMPAVNEPAARTVIAVPLRQSGRIVGVLNLYDKDGDRSFTPHDLDMILAFSTQASVAIDNVLLHQEAQRLSLTDALTGLWNYRYLTLALGHEIERATRFGRPLALLMLDLDRFKSINDEHGHQVGDAVLVEVAARMRSQVREVDTVARYGGEEFVIVLPETDAAGATRTADRIGAVIRSTRFVTASERGSVGLAVTASIGVAMFPDNGATAALLLHSVDEALYAAKGAGRDGWRFAPIVPALPLGD